MKIKYDITIDEAVDTKLRLLEFLNTAKRFKRQNIVDGIIAVIIVATLLFMSFYFGIPDTKSVKLIFASAVTISYLIIMIFFYPMRYKKRVRKRVKKLVTESLGTANPIPCEEEFNEKGIVSRHLGKEIRFQWNNVTKINETDNYLEFLFEKTSIVFIPKRAFKNEQQKNEWLHYAEEKTNRLIPVNQDAE